MSEKKMLQGIASILEETLPEDWSKVVFYAEYAEGAFSIEYYVAGSGKDDFVKCFDQKGVSRASLMKIFMAINKFIEPERAALKPEKRWGSMTLILHSNGKFKVDYDYSDMTENAYARKKAWKKKYLASQRTVWEITAKPPVHTLRAHASSATFRPARFWEPCKPLFNIPRE